MCLEVNERHVLRKGWTTCLTFANHSRLNSKHKGGGGLYDHTMKFQISF